MIKLDLLGVIGLKICEDILPAKIWAKIPPARCAQLKRYRLQGGKRIISEQQLMNSSYNVSEFHERNIESILVISRVGSECRRDWLNDRENQYNNTSDRVSTRHLTVKKDGERLRRKLTFYRNFFERQDVLPQFQVRFSASDPTSLFDTSKVKYRPSSSKRLNVVFAFQLTNGGSKSGDL